ncbi:MAG: oligoribonuclease [Bdellovibrionales bacterium]|nr:oligoribonuclease [Bdellovibrionales bacterium]
MEKLFWLDMEMTGLDVEQEVPIEIAVIVTDKSLNELGSYHAVINQPSEYLDNMDEWNQTHHEASGLLAKIPNGKLPHTVEAELIDFVSRHFGEEKVILAGNTIGQDRLFINKYFKRLADFLHYRQLDVTSWKLIFNNLYNIKFEKETNHRALDDVRESIEELKYYLQFITPSR